MAEQEHNKAVESGEEVVEVQDRGLFDFTRKKEEMKDEEALATGVEKIHIDEEVKVEEEDKKEGLLEKLHRSHSSSSSSSSDEEETFEGEKKKKKKGLKEKIKEKIGCDKKEGEEKQAIADEGDDTAVVVEKIEESVKIEAVAAPEEEKKGFLDKIKEKLPGNKKPVAAEEIPQPVVEPDAHGQEGKEKKGFLGKIMDKLPGYSKAAKESEN